MFWSFEKILLIAVVILTLWTHTYEAFCVYNRMDGENTRIRVYQAGLDNISTNFQKEIESGQGECCHWSNSDCNKSRTPDSPVHFHVQIGFKGINIKNSGIYLASCYAGGALELGGHDYHSLTATCYGPSGQYRNKTLSITDISKVDLSLSYLAH